MFLRLLQPTAIAALTGAERDTTELLLGEHLLLRLGNLVTTAPYRMRRWPIWASSAQGRAPRTAPAGTTLR